MNCILKTNRKRNFKFNFMKIQQKPHFPRGLKKEEVHAELGFLYGIDLIRIIQ